MRALPAGSLFLCACMRRSCCMLCMVTYERVSSSHGLLVALCCGGIGTDLLMPICLTFAKLPLPTQGVVSELGMQLADTPAMQRPTRTPIAPSTPSSSASETIDAPASAVQKATRAAAGAGATPGPQSSTRQERGGPRSEQPSVSAAAPGGSTRSGRSSSMRRESSEGSATDGSEQGGVYQDGLTRRILSATR